MTKSPNPTPHFLRRSVSSSALLTTVAGPPLIDNCMVTSRTRRTFAANYCESFRRTSRQARREGQVHDLPNAIVTHQVEMVDATVADLSGDPNDKRRPHHRHVTVDL